MPPKGEFYNPDPFTPVKVEVLNTLSGKSLSKELTVYLDGGEIKISELVKSMDKESIAKMGLDELSKKEQESMYISYTSDSDYKLQAGTEYTMLLTKQADGIYTVRDNGYGIFNIDKAKQKLGKTTLTNVLTGKVTTLSSIK